MRGSTLKKLTKWSRTTWNETPTDQRQGFRDFDHYLERIKNEWTSNPQFKKFINHTLKEGIV